MTDSTPAPTAQDPSGDRIDARQESQLNAWARKLDASKEQIKEAISTVGDKASDVEEHLKGTRSTTNSERTRKVLQQDDPSDR